MDGAQTEARPEAGALDATGDAELDTAPDAASEPTWLDDPSAPLPDTLSQLGLYPNLEDPSRVDERARYYQPRWPLWSNGSEKRRYAFLPGTVDVRDRDAWLFGNGATFFKTFFFGEAGDEHPIETRIMRRHDDRWEFAAYAWRADGSDADLLDGERDVPVRVEVDGESFTHQIPSRLACRACHESAPAVVLGFGELQLNHGAGVGMSWLARFADRLEPGPPADPDAIEVGDQREYEILGYLTGNCIHCHNGSDVGPNSVYDLRYPVALANLIGRETDTSASASGIRVVPGDPDASVLIRGFLRDDAEAKPMPPVGVQRRDDRALTLLRTWIAGLK